MNPIHTKKESPEPSPSCSQPLHVKRLERALNLQVFLNQSTSANNTTDDSDLTADDDSKDASDDNTVKLDILMNGNVYNILILFVNFYIQMQIRSIIESFTIQHLSLVVELG